MSTLITDNGNITNVNTGTIKDSTGNTTAITIDGSGRVAQPQKPYLFAQRTGTNGAITPTAFTGKIPYNAVLASSGGISLDTSTSLFTVPVTGLYQINAAVRLQANRTFVYWAVVDDNSGSPQVLPDADGGNNIVLCHGQDAGFTTATGACMQILRTGKSYYLRANDSSGSATTVQTIQTWMQIYFVG
tara:strand:- start:168 stop:731 length:564 start_codon:yes stop_codon:yes gene_type:complete